MKGTMLYGAGDVSFDERPDPTIKALFPAVGSLSQVGV